MADLTLSNGREITFDLSKMTLKEYQGIFNPREADSKSNATLAKVGGMTLAEYESLPFLDYRRYFQAFIAKTREPLADPNSQSASISA